MSIRTPSDVGAAARQQREKLGISQEQFAVQLGTTQGRISRFERGDGSINLRTLLQLLAALDLQFVILTQEKRDDAPTQDENDEIDLGAIANTGLKLSRRPSKR